MHAARADRVIPTYCEGLDFCKMDIGPIFFKEISFFDFLEEST
jgi:hypothetical protein